MTRSSKKLGQEELERDFAENNKKLNFGVLSPKRVNIDDKDYVSNETKEYILRNRKEKKIKK